MSVREYVGARYVPKYDGEWDNTKTYEPLTIVTVENVGSYTSKKLVPAGVDITNTEYWALSGATSGQIIQLQNDVADLRTDVAELQSLDKRSILVIGNSYVYTGGTSGLESLFAHAYQKTNGNDGFVAFTGHSHTFEDSLDSAIVDADIPKNEITDILFVSAVGDDIAYTELGASSYQSALNTTITSIMTKIGSNFPNIKKVACTLATTRNQVNFTNRTWSSSFKVHRLLRERLPIVGIEYLGWSGFVILMRGAAYFESDNIHPSAGGLKMLDCWIRQSYFGHAEYRYLRSYADVPYYYTAAGTIHISVNVNPDIVELYVRVALYTGGDPVTIAANDILFSTKDLTIPAPVPTEALEVYTPVINAGNGNLLETMHLQCVEDDGCLGIKLLSAPTHTTTNSSSAAITALSNFSYLP